MTYGGGPFGRAFQLHTELVNGHCPMCHQLSIFVGVDQNLYRCTSCGGELEQKVNGVISYMPITAAGVGPPPEIKLMDADGPKKA